jgi:hypothetical protein
MAVVAAGGMGKAADKLNVSQPAISKAIADLEHTLGVRLLDRSRRGVEPTSDIFGGLDDAQRNAWLAKRIATRNVAMIVSRVVGHT